MSAKKKTGGRRSLSRREIIDAALGVLEEQGADALSLRRVAERLGVAPNALYTHVNGKEDLIDGLVDQVYAELDLDPGPSEEWMQQMIDLSQSIRAHLLAHPAVVPFALQQPGLGPHELRLGEAIFNVLRPAGFSDAGVVGTVYALLSYILGFVALEVSRASADPPSSDDFVRRLRAFFTALPVAEFPQHVELAPLLAPFSADDQFQFGIRTFLVGLEAQHARRDERQPDPLPSANGPVPRKTSRRRAGRKVK